MLYDLRKNSNIVSILQGIICIYIDRHPLYFIYIDYEYFLDLLVVQQPSVDIGSIQSTSRAIGNYKKPKHIENQKFFQVFLYAAYTPMWPLVSRNYNKNSSMHANVQ